METNYSKRGMAFLLAELRQRLCQTVSYGTVVVGFSVYLALRLSYRLALTLTKRDVFDSWTILQQRTSQLKPYAFTWMPTVGLFLLFVFFTGILVSIIAKVEER